MYFDQHCYSSFRNVFFFILVLNPLGYKPLCLYAQLKPLMKLYEPRAYGSCWPIVTVLYFRPAMVGKKIVIENPRGGGWMGGGGESNTPCPHPFLGQHLLLSLFFVVLVEFCTIYPIYFFLSYPLISAILLPSILVSIPSFYSITLNPSLP